MVKIILASGSEWRKRLLAMLELPFEVVESGIDETQFEWEEPSEVVATLAAMKAEKVMRELGAKSVEQRGDERQVVIGADTLISIDNPPSHEASTYAKVSADKSEGHRQLIGKPRDMRDAKRIVRELAGRTHEVWTGVCVIDADTGERVVETERTEVEFRQIGEKQLEKYLETKEWEGKAGAYQIQGAIKPYVKDIRGSYTNVIGLPMMTLVDMLEKMGVWVEGKMEEVLMQKFGYQT